MVEPIIITPVVALMLKAPHPGQVKTRLARAIGVQRATEAYRRLVEHQIRQIPKNWMTQVHFTPPDAVDEMLNWLGPIHAYRAQSSGHLGDRLRLAMEAHFATSAAPLIFVGADCPYLTTKCLNEVSMLLEGAGVILIPALDGGYCLLALREPVRRIFHDIPWTTGAVADQTRQRLREEQIAWKELPLLEDVDDEASWARARKAFPHLDLDGCA